MDALADRLENEGILTFEALFRHVSSKRDLLDIVGAEFGQTHHALWREMRRRQVDDLQTPSPAPNVQVSSSFTCNPSDDAEGKTVQTGYI